MDDSGYILMLYSKYAEQCYSKFLRSEKPFVKVAKEVLDNTFSCVNNVEMFMNDVLNVAISNMMKMALVYQSEMFKNGFLNEALPDEKHLFDNIKNKVKEQNKSINNSQIYKLIREAIVHSDSEHPNCQVVGIDEFSMKLKPKGQPEINICLSNKEMLQLISVFNLNIEKAMYDVEIKEIDLQNAINSGLLDTKNVENYVSVKQYGEQVVFDDYQKDALVNYFYSNNQILKNRYDIGSACGQILLSRIPFQSNPYNLYTDYMKIVYYFMSLSRHAYMNIEQMEKEFYDFNMKNNVPFKEFITVNPEVDISYNIVLASLASLATSVTKQELVQIFKNAGVSIDEETARHLRNSMAHGRYFINQKENPQVEFYDGKDYNSLSHFLSLQIQDIDKIITNQIFNYSKTLTYPGEKEK